MTLDGQGKEQSEGGPILGEEEILGFEGLISRLRNLRRVKVEPRHRRGIESARD